jgi:methyl-accepting chemotaxis protein
LWRICVNKNQLTKYSNSDVEISHSLGLFHGSALWMEEIFNRYYFATLNAFVYFGAAILLILVGMRKFSNYVSDTAVILGFILEASMLVLMFIFMLFSPKDEELVNAEEISTSPQDELIDEIGEIARDFANATLNLEKITSDLNSIQQNQNHTFQALNEISKNLANATSPNPEMMESMKEVNKSLLNFTNHLDNLNIQLENIKIAKIETAVRNELAKIIIPKLNDGK